MLYILVGLLLTWKGLKFIREIVPNGWYSMDELLDNTGRLWFRYTDIVSKFLSRGKIMK